MQSSKEAYVTWKTTLPGRRRELLHALANLIEKHAAELSSLESLDAGILYRDSTGLHVPQSIENLRYFAGYADKVDGETLTIPEGMAYTRRQPIGVCAAIVPWNSPLYVKEFVFALSGAPATLGWRQRYRVKGRCTAHANW